MNPSIVFQPFHQEDLTYMKNQIVLNVHTHISAYSIPISFDQYIPSNVYLRDKMMTEPSSHVSDIGITNAERLLARTFNSDIM